LAAVGQKTDRRVHFLSRQNILAVAVFCAHKFEAKVDTMKLYHRTSYWGDYVQGHQSKLFKFPVIHVQALLSEEYGTYGCCHHRGRRCIELDETHFISNHRDDWNLYHVRTVLGEGGIHGEYYHDFALLPKSQATAKNVGKGWSLLGSVRACTARIDLAPLLRPFLVTNDYFQYYAKHHAHIAVAMERIDIDVTRHERRERAPLRDKNGELHCNWRLKKSAAV
jgi:hypothetical protein